MVDMVAPSGRVAPVQPGTSLEEQFPVGCYIRSYLRQTIRCSKVAVLRARERKTGTVRAYASAHEVVGEWAQKRARPLPPTLGAGACHHYTWTQAKLNAIQVQRNMSHGSPYFHEDATKARDYTKLLQWATRPDGVRINSTMCKEPYRSNAHTYLFLDKRWEALFPCRCNFSSYKMARKLCGCSHR